MAMVLTQGDVDAIVAGTKTLLIPITLNQLKSNGLLYHGTGNEDTVLFYYGNGSGGWTWATPDNAITVALPYNLSDPAILLINSLLYTSNVAGVWGVCGTYTLSEHTSLTVDMNNPVGNPEGIIPVSGIYALLESISDVNVTQINGQPVADDGTGTLTPMSFSFLKIQTGSTSLEINVRVYNSPTTSWQIDNLSGITAIYYGSVRYPVVIKINTAISSTVTGIITLCEPGLPFTPSTDIIMGLLVQSNIIPAVAAATAAESIKATVDANLDMAISDIPATDVSGLATTTDMAKLLTVVEVDPDNPGSYRLTADAQANLAAMAGTGTGNTLAAAINRLTQYIPAKT